MLLVHDHTKGVVVAQDHPVVVAVVHIPIPPWMPTTADRRDLRPKAAKLVTCPALHDDVAGKLGDEQHWTPKQISHRLRLDFPDDEQMRISHEAIYHSLNVQGRAAPRRAGSSPPACGPAALCVSLSAGSISAANGSRTG